MSAENLEFDQDLIYRQRVRDFIAEHESRFDFYQQKRMILEEVEKMDFEYDKIAKSTQPPQPIDRIK